MCYDKAAVNAPLQSSTSLIQAGGERSIIELGDVLVADTSPMKKGLNTILKVLPLGGAATGAVQ